MLYNIDRSFNRCLGRLAVSKFVYSPFHIIVVGNIYIWIMENSALI
jgi:hypothetical protein